MKLGFLAIMMPFLFGLIISQVFSDGNNLKIPFSDGIERSSPYDRVKESQIFVYNDRIVLQVRGASLAEYADTNSMDPFIDIESNGIEVEPKSDDEIHVGDVIAYESDIGLIVHRIIGIGHDENGKYFILKGDNNNESDPYKVRFEQIKYVMIGVIY